MEDDLIEVRESPIHGNGVFAKRRVPRRTLIGQYEGRRYEPGETIESDVEGGMTYLFALSDGGTIDGSEGGNATRFINHSCAPNCAARETYDADDALVVEVHTLRSIPVGAELFLDYRLIRDPSDDDPHACACGAPTCRGTMVWPT
jgi:hypothetical protein